MANEHWAGAHAPVRQLSAVGQPDPRRAHQRRPQRRPRRDDLQRARPLTRVDQVQVADRGQLRRERRDRAVIRAEPGADRRRPVIGRVEVEIWVIAEVNVVFGSHPTEPYWVNR